MDWIDVNERLPLNNIWVVLCQKHKETQMEIVLIGKRVDENWVDEIDDRVVDDEKYIVSHWMHLNAVPSSRVHTTKKGEILDAAYCGAIDYIKSIVKEQFDKEGIQYDIQDAISDGVKEYLLENEEYFYKIISRSLENKFNDLEISIKMK